MKQKRNLIVLLGVLVVVMLAYVGVTKYTEAKAEAEAEAEALLAEENTIYVSDLDYSSIVEVTFYYTEELTFELVDDTWLYAENPTVPITDTYISYIVSDYSTLIAERDLSGGEEISAYGLDEPSYYVILTDDTGTETTFYIGDAADTGYYLTIGDKSSVYTVDSGYLSDICYSLMDFVVDDTFPSIESTEMTEVTITQGELGITYTAEDSDDLLTIATGITSLLFDTCVDVDGSDHLEDYELDEESRITIYIQYEVEVESETTDDTEEDSEEVEVETETKEAILYVGTYDFDYDTFYVQVDGSNLIYEVDGATMRSLMNME